jgi:LmbE family N-acetylglucosaminyl deacetylase
MASTFQRILVLAPHTDDAEFAAGASICRWIREGREVHAVAFSACQTSVPEGLPRDVLFDEVERASGVIGIPRENLRVLDFEVRQFDAARQEILQTLVDLELELQPDLVLMPAREDLHQDHATIANEGLRAFKRRSILAYDVPWNHLAFRTECFVAVEEPDVEKKVEAVQCYGSQAHRLYTDPEYIRSQLRFRGTQSGVRYAEAYEVVRWVL